VGQNSTAGGSRLGENVRVSFPTNQVIPLNQGLKLILLSTHDNSLEIFFNPQTQEFYTITTENESEDDERDETLITDASQLAHSVRARDLHFKVTDAQPQAYGFRGLSPTHRSISTAGDRVRSDQFVSEYSAQHYCSVTVPVHASVFDPHRVPQKVREHLGLKTEMRRMANRQQEGRRQRHKMAGLVLSKVVA
jgi:hypothetical protein